MITLGFDCVDQWKSRYPVTAAYYYAWYENGHSIDLFHKWQSSAHNANTLIPATISNVCQNRFSPCLHKWAAICKQKQENIIICTVLIPQAQQIDFDAENKFELKMESRRINQLFLALNWLFKLWRALNYVYDMEIQSNLAVLQWVENKLKIETEEMKIAFQIGQIEKANVSKWKC